MTTWEIQKEIHSAVKKNLREGMTELELAEVISSICPEWQGDLISGERTADIEGAPGDRIIKKGDVVLLDLQVCSDKQWSDLTRVYFLDNVTGKQKDAYEKVLNAITAGEKLLLPGTKAKDIYSCMREAICSKFAFEHHGGHRIGTCDVVAEPRFFPECEDTLKQGMIVTLEPAIYFPEEFGIRFENNYLITDTGFKRLDDLATDITEFIVKG